MMVVWLRGVKPQMEIVSESRGGKPTKFDAAPATPAAACLQWRRGCQKMRLTPASSSPPSNNEPLEERGVAQIFGKSRQRVAKGQEKWLDLLEVPFALPVGHRGLELSHFQSRGMGVVVDHLWSKARAGQFAGAEKFRSIA